MGNLRGHEPFTIEDFNGLWRRGDPDACPLDHFSESTNIRYIESGFETRYGIEAYLGVGSIVRIQPYRMLDGESLLVLDDEGHIHHVLLDGSGTVFRDIYVNDHAKDFNAVSINGRAYFTAFDTDTDDNGINFQRGINGEFLQVYLGDGSDSRRAGGDPPTNSDDAPFIAYPSAVAGKTTPGFHYIAVSYFDGVQDSTGLGTTVKPLVYIDPSDPRQIVVDHLPIGPGSTDAKRIWMTKAISLDEFNTDPDNFDFYRVKSISNSEVQTVIDAADADLATIFVPGTMPNPTSGGLQVENTNVPGHTDIGVHVVGVVYETNTGFLTKPGPEILAVQTFADSGQIKVSNIPLGGSTVIARHLVASKTIENYNGDDRGYQLFFIPGGTLPDNTDTDITLGFYDSELLDDASHLLDNFDHIPSGVGLTQYHGRLVLTTPFSDPSVAYISAAGEPEAIDQVDGLVVIPPDGNPLTNAQEFRDVLYLFQKTKTWAVNDNGDVPTTWGKPLVIDQGIGASVHGIGTVLDSGGVNIDFLLIVDYSGIMVFNGSYQRPELTWKIADVWTLLDRNSFDYLQLMNDSLNQRLYLNYPLNKILYGDYRNGLDAKNIRWAIWQFEISTASILLVHTDTLLIAAKGL